MTSTDAILLAVVILLVIAVIAVAYPLTIRRLKGNAGATIESVAPAPEYCTPREIVRLSGDDAASAPECRRVGAWDVYPGAWTESPGHELPGSPYAGLTTSRCAALCAADGKCAAWVNNPGAYCRHYSIVPGVVTGSSANTVGFRHG
jgi:hypothetical protein